MIVIIPEAIDGLSALIKGLANYSIEDIKKQGYFNRVDFYLPKFKIESSLSLREPLEQVDFSH